MRDEINAASAGAAQPYDAALYASTSMCTAGGWFAFASGLFIIALLLHGVPSPEVAEFMQIIADEGGTWVLAHWLAAIALSSFAVASVIALSAHSRLTGHWLPLSAWAILLVSSLWVVVTAVAEATAIAHIASTADLTRFEPWHDFVEGMAMGFFGIALALAAIAWNEVRSGVRTVPRWASWIGFAAAGIAALGWLMGPVAGIQAGGPIWLIGTIVASLWGVWFGVSLLRAR